MVKQIGARVVAAAALVAGLLTSGVTGTTAVAATCTPILSSASQGSSVLSLASNNLATIAGLNNITPAELRTRLTDPTFWIDACGKSYYQEPIDTSSSTPTAITAPYPYSQTFLLHSRPTATKVIYLDFDGETLSGTAWNATYNGGADIVAPGLSIDADYTTFNNAEMDVIQWVWAAVAEDYAAFDVDVTTQAPLPADITYTGTGDTKFGTRALITDDTFMYAKCACGGNAYTGVFNYSANHPYYQPALIFTQGLGGAANAKSIAEAAAHEVGHNLGLSHDGTSVTSGGVTTVTTYYSGANGWAPIMGVGYYEPLSQWSKGEYTNANQKQDDYAVMATYGIALRADDWGSSTTSFGTLTTSTVGPTSVTGVISTQTDIDWFKYVPTVSGSYTFAASPNSISPNLDIKLGLNTGTTVTATSNPTYAKVDATTATGLDATITANLVAGTTYYLTIDGSASTTLATGGNTDYSSRGQYTLTATYNPPPLAISTTTLANAGINTPYSATIATTGGAGGNSFAITAGSLPTGLTISTSGVISGTASAAGTSTFIVQVTDSKGATASASLSLTVAVLPPTISTTTLPPASTTLAYSTTLIGVGSGTLTWTATGVPAGLTLSTSGDLSGTPTTVATYSMVVTVTDSASGLTSSKTFSIAVTAPLTITNTSLPGAKTTTNYTTQMTSSGGATTKTWSATGIPAGLTFSTAGKFGGKATTKGTYSITFVLTDSAGRVTTKTLSLVVA